VGYNFLQLGLILKLERELKVSYTNIFLLWIMVKSMVGIQKPPHNCLG